ncbi:MULTISPECIES: DUF3298 and DUF4163 domain-containing protein [Bacillus]|uniref:Deacetylase PdaC domain-containing protein n=2 Tax=Bacillus TaxID=1386 RepID=A0A0M4FHQ6_9BACI|nr:MULTISPECIES: DUF3298 and DUF4163 domain-containing protein [Bacillus]ALC80641.1 hypothetical protein AM592_02860 [Bacillus gobiensis]MBP1079525.1 hypothetical protein [Bacillus capparidis]MED1094927.1 DUF3298 and DUF4163 domain-containing protein [Bacillus capparidis]
MRKKYVRVVVMVSILLFAASLSFHPKAEANPRENVIVDTKYYKDIKELKYPQVRIVGNPSFERKINNDFTNYIKKSYKAYKDNLEAAKKYGYEPQYQSDFDVKYNKNNKLSILTSDYIFTGGAHGNTVVQSFNYDLLKKKRVKLDDILTNQQKFAKVTDYVYQYAKARPNIFYPDLKKEDVKINKNTAFFFTDDGIALVFQQYDIAPYVSGNQVIVIPSSVYK